MRQRRHFPVRRLGALLLVGAILGLLAGLGEVVHLTWFVQGGRFRPIVLAYALIIDGGLGLAAGFIVGVVAALLPLSAGSPRPTTAPLAPVSVQRVSRRGALRLAGAAGGALALAACGLTVAGRRGPAYAAATTPSPAKPGTGRPPNVLLVTLDTVRADFLPAYGGSILKTPSLDKFAAEGARFNWHMVQEPQTNPSHGAMFTGMYPPSSGIRVHMVDKLPSNLTPLAQVFQTAGYATAGLYSWLSFDPQYCGFDRGFQTYKNVAGKLNALESGPLRGLAADYRVAEQFLAAPRAFSSLVGLQDSAEFQDKGRADVTTDAAIAQLQIMSGQPFFLWVHYFDSHYPYNPPPGYAEQYNPNYKGPINSSMDVVNAIESGKFKPQGQDLVQLQSLYRGEISFMDQHLGRLFSELDSLGVGDHTVAVVTADHGESFGEHPALAEGADFFHPWSLNNEEQRTPLLLRYPGKVQPGTVVQAPSQAIDLYPTLLNLAGLPVPAQNQGASLVPLLDGTDSGRQRMAFGTMPDYSFTSVTVPGWKLINNNPSGTHELFDLAHDPGATRDMSDTEPRLANQLVSQAAAWMKATGII